MEKGYCQERRMMDVKSTHGFSKSAAQALILINGGAATAILASKSEIIRSMLDKKHGYVAAALAVYSAGVLLGALMNWCESQALYHFSQKWQMLADKECDAACSCSDEVISSHMGAGSWWHVVSKVIFLSSALSFAGGCIIIAYALWCV